MLESPTLCLFIYLFYCQRKICVMSTGPGDQWWSTERRKMWLQLAGSITMSVRLQWINRTAFSSPLSLYFCLNRVCLQRLEHLLRHNHSNSKYSIALVLHTLLWSRLSARSSIWHRITGNMTKHAFKSFPAVNNLSYIWPRNYLI